MTYSSSSILKYPSNTIDSSIATLPKDSGTLDEVRSLLSELHDEEYWVFHRLFQIGEPVDISLLKLDPGALIDNGICVTSAGTLQSLFMIKKLFDAFILTDFPHYTGEDRVLYLAEDESVYVAHSLPDCAGLSVLDIGTGSGVLPILACQSGASHVTALDVNDRALALAPFNATLNGCADKISFVKAAVADFTSPQTFDVVISNPPFIATPPGGLYRKSGAAGFDGLSVMRDILGRLDDFMHAHSIFLMLVLSPGGPHLSKIEEMWLDKFAYKRRRIVSTELYGGPHDLEIIFLPFDGDPDLDAWRKMLHEQDYTHIHCFLLEMFPDSAHSFIRRVQHPKLESKPETGTWEAKYLDIRKSKELT